jgi:hypothetical protein
MTPDIDQRVGDGQGAPVRRQLVVEGTDHDIPAERPDAVVDAVLELMANAARSSQPGTSQR